jgi:hypothetical protein
MDALIVIVIYALGILIVVGLGFLLYFRALASRRSSVCPQCGERLTVELMEATRCNTCGAPLAGGPR